MKSSIKKLVLITGLVLFPTALLAADLDIPSEVTLFKNVKIFDGTTDKLKSGLDVLVVKNKIHKVAKDIPTTGTYEVDVETGVSQEVIPALPGTGDYSSGYTIYKVGDQGQSKKKTVKVNVIDGGGRTLMPGLIDMHVHLSTFLPLQTHSRDMLHPYAHGALAILRAKEILMNGYTTLRDCGGPAAYLQEIIDEGVAAGPRIYPSENWITTTSGHGDFRELNDPHPNITGGRQHFYEEYVTMIADGPDETTRAVRETFRRGATQIKLFTSGGVTSLFDPLHSGPNPEEIRAAVKVAVQWDTYVLTHSFSEAAIRMAIDNGVKSIEHAPWLTDDMAKLMIEKGIYLATAVSPVLEVEVEYAKTTYPPESFKKWYAVRQAAENMLEVLKRNPEIKVVLGSDLLGPWQNQKEVDDKMNLEFKYFGRAIGNYRALRMATATTGEMNLMTGKMNPYTDGKLGVIEEGAYADILLVDGNPLDDIELMTNPEKNFKVIMKDGKIFKNEL